MEEILSEVISEEYREEYREEYSEKMEDFYEFIIEPHWSDVGHATEWQEYSWTPLR